MVTDKTQLRSTSHNAAIPVSMCAVFEMFVDSYIPASTLIAIAPPVRAFLLPTQLVAYILYQVEASNTSRLLVGH